MTPAPEQAVAFCKDKAASLASVLVFGFQGQRLRARRDRGSGKLLFCELPESVSDRFDALFNRSTHPLQIFFGMQQAGVNEIALSHARQRSGADNQAENKTNIEFVRLSDFHAAYLSHPKGPMNMFGTP